MEEATNGWDGCSELLILLALRLRSLLSSFVVRISEIVYGSEEYRNECELRDRLLRKPLGLSVYDENLEREKAYRHFGAFDADRIVGCLIVVPLDDGLGQLKQMGIEAALQGQGIGRQLITDVESRLSEEGVRELWLHGRSTAVGFYEGLGYRVEGESFVEVGIPHFKMRKALANRSGPVSPENR